MDDNFDESYLWGEITNCKKAIEPDKTLIDSVLKKVALYSEESICSSLSIPDSESQRVSVCFVPVTETIAAKHQLKLNCVTSHESRVNEAEFCDSTLTDMLKTSLILLSALEGFTEADAESIYVLTDILKDSLSKVASLLKLLVETKLVQSSSCSNNMTIVVQALRMAGLGTVNDVKEYCEKRIVKERNRDI